MPQHRTRSLSISGTSSGQFLGGRTVSPPGGNEQASKNSSQISLGSSGKSHWKLLSTQYLKPNRNTLPVSPRKTDSQPLQPVVISRPRAIVRKSLRVPPPVPEKDAPPKLVEGKNEETDSDDERTLVFGGDVIPQYREGKEVHIPKPEVILEKPPSISRVSRKILSVLPDFLDKEDQDQKPVSTKPEGFSELEARPKYVHWGLRSSLYQPEFIIEREDEPVVEPFTSLSPPTFHGRKKGAFNP